jgi:Mce-associated membrane protein
VAGEGRRSTPSPADAPADPVEIDEPDEVEETAPSEAQKVPAPRRTHAGLLHPPKRTQRWLWPLAGLTVLSVAFGAVAAVHRADTVHGVTSQASADDAASSAAATAAQGILGYSYTSVAADLAAAQRLMTPTFAKSFGSVMPTVESLAQQRKLVVKATVRNAAVLECGEDCSTDTVKVLLFVDQTRTSDGKALDPIAIRTVFTMTEQGGRWLVDDSVSV